MSCERHAARNRTQNKTQKWWLELGNLIMFEISGLFCGLVFGKSAPFVVSGGSLWAHFGLHEIWSSRLELTAPG